MKLTTTLPDGRLKVNKAAVIARLKQLRGISDISLNSNSHSGEWELPGLLPVSQREVAAEANEMVRYNADRFINTSDE